MLFRGKGSVGSGHIFILSVVEKEAGYGKAA